MAQPTTLNEISQIILSKERELHQFHDLRCGQLEALVEERDQLLLESSRRFEKLKDDFEYNLALIQARDVEIERLEHDLKIHQADLSNSTSERKQLISQIEAAQSRELDAMKKSELDRINNKKYLDELKDVIEQMQWSTDEEAHAKDREIESLRGDIRRLNALRDESLESQRRDLTHTFENILQQREEAHTGKEWDIADQIALLDTRFEQLQTENTRLKNELAGASRQCEHLAEDNAHKEEARRQLQWSLDDERSARAQAENVAAHQLQQVTLELSIHTENAAKDISELKRKLAQSKEEGSRDKEFRAQLEQRLEEMRRTALLDLTTLEKEVQECRGLESRLQREIAALREERDAALQRATTSKVELDAVDLRLSSLTVNCDGLAQELQTARERLRDAEEEASRLQREYQDYRCQTGYKENDTLQHVTQQLVEAKTHHLSETTLLKRAQTEELTKLRVSLEEQAQRRVEETGARHDADMLRVQRQLADVSSELEMTRATLQARTTELDEERKEAAALKLRFAAYEGQGQAQKQAARPQVGSNATAFAPPNAREHHYNPDSDPYAQQAARGRDGGNGAFEPPSPMFSEDLGPVSLSFPGSPLNTSVRPHYPAAVFRSDDFTGTDFNARRAAPREAFGTWSDGAGNTMQSEGRGVRDSHDSVESRGAHRGVQGGAASQWAEPDNALKTENEWLKSVIKEMRTEVEQLHAQNSNANQTRVPTQPATQNTSHPSAGRAHHTDEEDEEPSWFGEEEREEGDGVQRRGAEEARGLSRSQQQSSRASLDAEDRQKFGVLEVQNQRLVDELVRLRQERLSVMDVGNKLRSALNKQISAPEESTAEEAEQQLAQVDKVREWLTAPSHAHTHVPGAFGDTSFPAEDNLSGAEREMLRRNRARYEEELYREQQQRERRQREERQGLSADALLGHRPSSSGRGSSSGREPREQQRSNHRDHRDARGSRDRYAQSASDQEEEEDSEPYHRHRHDTRSKSRSGSRSRSHGRSHSRDRANYARNGSDEYDYSPSDDGGRDGRNKREGRNEGRSGAKKSPVEEQYTSAGHRVWGSPVRKESSAGGGAGGGAGAKQSGRHSGSGTTAENSNGAKQQVHPEIQLLGQSLAGTAHSLPAQDTSSFAPSGNLLSAASAAHPKSNNLSNSRRMTPSQMEALKRIQENKKRNSMFVGTNAGVAGVNPANVPAPPRKVMNYANYVNNNNA